MDPDSNIPNLKIKVIPRYDLSFNMIEPTSTLQCASNKPSAMDIIPTINTTIIR